MTLVQFRFAVETASGYPLDNRTAYVTPTTAEKCGLTHFGFVCLVEAEEKDEEENASRNGWFLRVLVLEDTLTTDPADQRACVFLSPALQNHLSMSQGTLTPVSPSEAVSAQSVVLSARSMMAMDRDERLAFRNALSRQLEESVVEAGSKFLALFLGQVYAVQVRDVVVVAEAPSENQLKQSHTIALVGSSTQVVLEGESQLLLVADNNTITPDEDPPPGLGTTCQKLLTALKLAMLRTSLHHRPLPSTLDTGDPEFGSRTIALVGPPHSGRSAIVQWCLRKVRQNSRVCQFDTKRATWSDGNEASAIDKHSQNTILIVDDIDDLAAGVVKV